MIFTQPFESRGRILEPYYAIENRIGCVGQRLLEFAGWQSISDRPEYRGCPAAEVGGHSRYQIEIVPMAAAMLAAFAMRWPRASPELRS